MGPCMKLRVEGKGLEPLQGLIGELRRGVAIVGDIDGETYRASNDGNGSIGAHFRHNLDFVTALLNGICAQKVDYNDRARELLVETRPAHAAQQMLFVVRRLESLSSQMVDRPLMVRSEINENVWHQSSVAREIEFVHSHTVHHYALIRGLLSERAAAADTFGVAPSTLRYRSRTERLLASN